MSSSVIGISGKTTLAEHLATRLRDEGVRVEIVHQDWHWQRSSLNKTAEGKRTWEGPQFTDWAWLEWSVMEAKQRASVVIVEGYLLNDCSTALFDSLDLLFWSRARRSNVWVVALLSQVTGQVAWPMLRLVYGLFMKSTCIEQHNAWPVLQKSCATWKQRQFYGCLLIRTRALGRHLRGTQFHPM